MKKIEDNYKTELDNVLEQNENSIIDIVANATEETQYLKTIIFRVENVASKQLRKQFEDYMEMCYESEYAVSKYYIDLF